MEYTKKIQRPGVTSDFLEKHGVKHVTSEEAKNLCGKSAESGLYIPYHTPEGKPISQNDKPFGRLRLDKPQGDKKYHQECGTVQVPYFPKTPQPRDNEVVLIEGEFKSLCLAEQNIPAVGLSGFFGFGKRKGNDDGEFKLNPLLENFISKNQITTVFFLGDTDTALNYEFARAAVRLRQLLPSDIGLKLPRLPMDSAKGVDDCCQEMGAARFGAFMMMVIDDSVVVDADDVDGLQRKLLFREKHLLVSQSKTDPEFREWVHGRMVKVAAAAKSETFKVDVNALNREISGLSIGSIRQAVKKLEKARRLRNGPKLEEVSLYFDQASDKFAVEVEPGKWAQLSQSKTAMVLGEMGVSSEPPEKGQRSPLHICLSRAVKSNHVRIMHRLAGWQAGVTVAETGEKVLVMRSPELVEPREGTFETFDSFLSQLLGSDDPGQLVYFHCWMKSSVTSLRSFNPRLWTRSQVLFLVGPANCGKSLLQALISELLDRGACKPFAYMTGATPFNSDLFKFVHLKMEDEQSKLDIGSRREFGTRIKDALTNFEFHLHEKGREPVVVKSLRRMTVSINDEPENMRIIPPLDKSMKDKMSILICKQPRELVGSIVTVRSYVDRVMAELPQYLWWLINEFEIPEDWQNPRSGVEAYISRSTLDLIDEQSPEKELLEQLDLLMGWKDEDNEHQDGIVRRRSSSIMADLKTCPRTRAFAVRNYIFSNSFGQLLTKLRNLYPERVDRFTGHKKTTLWSIYPNEPTPGTDEGYDAVEPDPK